MKGISTKEIDLVRAQGFRPGAVACVLHNERLLLLFKREYNLWMLPQGGIDNGERIKDSLSRELEEELGKDFMSSLEDDHIFLFEDRIEFTKRHHGARELKTDDGEDVLMVGKHYYYYVLNSKEAEIDLSKTEFDQYKWVDYVQGIHLAQRLCQKNKGAVLQKVLDTLKEQKLIIA